MLLWTCPIRTGSSFGKQGAVLIGVGIAPCKWGLLVIDIDEQMFYNWDIATGKRVEVWEDCKMGEGNSNEYKQKIIELIQNCDNVHWLKTIYAYVKTLLK